MAEVVSPEDIKKTQASLAQYIKEPPLTEKLLKKPPFRFLLDVIKSVIKDTGFLSDVFTVEELNLENIKDKEGKIAFLKKLITVLKDTTGSSISAKPNKIVAGLEVTKTLELLQAVGKGIALKQSGEINVQKERSENKKNTREKNSNEKEKETVKKVKIKKDNLQEEPDKTKKKVKSSSRENGSSDKKKKQKVEPDKSKSKDNQGNVENEPKNIETSDLKTVEKNLNVNNEIENVSNGQSIGSKDVNSVENVNTEVSTKNVTQESANENKIGVVQNGEIFENGPSAVKEVENKNNAISNENKKIDETPTKPERRPSTRRSSSRTRPSSKIVNENMKKEVIKEKVEDNILKKAPQENNKTGPLPVLGTGDATPISVPKIERPTTARKAPPSARAPGVPKAKDKGEVKLPEISDKDSEIKPVEVITENNVQEDDDKENMVVVETQPLAMDSDIQDSKFGLELGNEEVGENEGALVAQILETKRELEESKQQWVNPNQRNVEIEWESGRKQKRDSWEKEITKLREEIQELTRTTNPLGKLFDFLQEDVDSMQRELKSWITVGQQYKNEVIQEQKMTENIMEKYRKQLAELDSLIEQEQEAVRNIKANILSNDRKIFNLVTRTNTSDY